MNLRNWLRILTKVVVSILGAGIFYTGWLIIFLMTAKLSPALETIGWLLAPVVTAVGFTVGVVIFERLTGMGRVKFLQVFIWPLVGCVLGAGAIFWLGAMLIVFGMFILGTLTVTLREVVLAIKYDQN